MTVHKVVKMGTKLGSKHTTACGKLFGYRDNIEWEKTWRKVTCKNCLEHRNK